MILFMKTITELLNIKYPVLQGAMANISTHTLVAAVSNAGGLGVLATGFNEPDWVRDEIRKIKLRAMNFSSPFFIIKCKLCIILLCKFT